MNTTSLIKKTLKEDQADRSSLKFKKLSFKKRWEVLQKNDLKRITRIEDLLKTKKLKAIDYFRAGIILEHGPELKYIKKARQLAKKGMQLNHSPSKWLFAATTDRILMWQGKKQKFGTQFQKNRKGSWELYPVRSSTTDEERDMYNVKTLQGIKNVVLQLNSTSKNSKQRIGLTQKQ